MFQSLLKELYYENCGQIEKIKGSRELDRLEKKAYEQYNKLFAVLDDEHKQWLERIWETRREMENCYLNFRAGLQFGVRLAVEALGYTREGDLRED